MIQSPSNYGYAAPVQQAYPQQAPAEYNAIKINIVDPKVNAPGAQQPSAYAYPQSQIYSYPQAQAPVYYPPVNTPAPAPVQPQVPAPQVVNQQTVNQVPPSVVTPQTQAPVQQPQPAPAAPEAPAAAEQQVNTNEFNMPATIAQIKGNDLEQAGNAIEKVADIAQNKPELAPKLLDTELMEALLGVIGKDTTTLEGPTEHQKDLRQQVLAGKQLSEADMAEANKISPLEMAERNKQYALFTTAILQNLLIDEFKKTNNMTPDIKDLPGMEQIVTTIKDNPNPMLRASGLAALAYNARPEYKPVMKEIFELSKQDADENVQKVAAEGLAKLDTIMDVAPAAKTAEMNPQAAPAQAA